MSLAATQFLPQRAGRARPFRPVRRALRRRDADAADPRAGEGLRRGQGRPRIQARDGELSHPLCRPALAALFRRTADRAPARVRRRPAGGRRKIYFKRDELNHTGAHKVNNVLGQILLAQRMGKPRIIAETGAGQHGVATATLCARFGLKCVVYMGAVDVERQEPNVFRMKLLGAEVRPVQSGSKTLKDAMNEALRDWVTNVEDTFYCIGTVAGPHPYPMMVRDFQSVIGRETREQMHGGGRPAARFARRLHRRRLQCDGPVPPLPRRRERRNLRRRGGRPRHSTRPACRLDHRRAARRAARQPHLSPDGRGRPDQRGAFDLGRARLSRHRPGALLAPRCRPRDLSLGDRPRGARCLPALLQARRHHPGARAGPRARPGDQARAARSRRIT